MMDYSLFEPLQDDLDPGEKLLWTGRPKQGIVFRPADWFLIPFSLIWCGFAIFWLVMAMSFTFAFALFGVPFVIVGLIFVFGRFFIDAQQRARTWYGITDDRIIIRSGWYRQSVQSLNIRTLSDVAYTERADGSGTINLGPRNPYLMWMSGMNWWPGMKAAPALELIPEVRQVYGTIVKLQRAK